MMAWRRIGDKPLSEPMLIQFTDAYRYVHTCAGGRGRKIGFNTNHYTRSHMRGRGAEAEREQKPLRKMWVQHPIYRTRFETARSKPSLSSRNVRSAPRPLRVCVNIPAVAERECQNPPAYAPQPPRACVKSSLYMQHLGGAGLKQKPGTKWLPSCRRQLNAFSLTKAFWFNLLWGFLLEGLIDNKSALLRIMACHLVVGKAIIWNKGSVFCWRECVHDFV